MRNCSEFRSDYFLWAAGSLVRQIFAWEVAGWLGPQNCATGRHQQSKSVAYPWVKPKLTRIGYCRILAHPSWEQKAWVSFESTQPFRLHNLVFDHLAFCFPYPFAFWFPPFLQLIFSLPRQPFVVLHIGFPGVCQYSNFLTLIPIVNAYTPIFFLSIATDHWP